MTLKHGIRICIGALLIYGTYFVTAQKLRAELENDIRSWQTLNINTFENEQWRVTAGAQSRLYDEGKFLGTWLIFPTVQYKAHPNLDLGATYLLEDTRSEAGDDYTRLHIFWLHANSHWQLTEKLKFSMRHLAGLREIESKDDYWISRHRFNIDYKLKDFGHLVGLGASTEVFVRYDTDEVFENRFIPIKASFKLTDRSQLSLFIMMQSKRGVGCSNWENAYILGQSFNYKF
ncbi:DUF2490 domain-containing protein [Thalassobacterium sedimentorum]|nr:DUF2490 domain-containing protein [Coraliomargarita sp. SDUM461004]